MPNPWEMNWSNSPAGTVTVRPYTQQDASLPTSPDVPPNTQENVPWKMTWQQPEASISGDIPALAGKALTGIGQAATAPLGAAEAISGGVDWLGRQVSPWYAEQSDKTNKKIEEVRSQAPFNIPSPTDAVRWLASKLPQPKSDAGKIAGAAIEAIPSAVALTPNAMANVPNALNAAVRYGAVPAAASEVAGNAVQGTALETPVRIGTSLLTSGLMGMIPGGVKNPQVGPTNADLKAQSKAALKRVEAANIIVDPKAYQTTINDMFGELSKEGFNPSLHPRVQGAIESLEKNRGSAVTTTNLENMRRIAKDAIASNVPSEQFLGKVMVKHLDKLVDNLSPANTIGGNPNAALTVASDLKEFRKAWSQLRKSETIERLQERATNRAAQYSNAGEENALRVEFRNLAQNDKKMRLFSKEEQDAIRRVARGGFMENTFRDIGKWSPTSLGLGPVTANAGAGFLLSQILGPAGWAVPPIAGAVSKSIATNMTKRNAEIANALMRGVPVMPAQNPSAAILYNALMQGK